MSFEVNTGTAASALDGTEKIPVSQGALPRVITTARFPYLNAADYIFTNKPVNIDNGTGAKLVFGDATDPSTTAGLTVDVTDGAQALFNCPSGVNLRTQADGGSIANSGGSTTYFSWSSAAGASGCTGRFAPSGSSTGLRLFDADGSHTLNIAVGSDLTATRTLTLTTGNANRTLDISAGSVTISQGGAAITALTWSAGTQIPALTAAGTAALKTVGASAGNILDKAAGDSLYQPVDADLDALATSGVASGWTAFSPTISAGSGSFGSAATTGGTAYLQIGKLVFFRLRAVITAVGTASVSVLSTLPVPAKASTDQTINGMEGGGTGNACRGIIAAGDVTHLQIKFYDNTFPGATGNVILMQGHYEAD